MKYATIAFFIFAILSMVFVSRFVSQELVLDIVNKSGNWGVVILILAFWITHVFAPISGSPFLFAGFYAYGHMTVLYGAIAALLAAISNFWIAKIWGRRLVEKLAGRDDLAKIDKLAHNYGLQTLFIFRLFLKDFHDVISYAFGLTDMKFKNYFLVTLLGMIPSTIVWYLISLQVSDPLVFTALSWTTAWISLTAFFLWHKLSRH